jgi:hypothetical protein
MVLIDFTFFKRSLFIAQKSQQEVRDNIDDYIQDKEPEILKRLLGNELYTDFMDGLELDPVPQKWVDLKSNLVDEDLKKSLIANYVYCAMLHDEATENSGIGVVRKEGENSQKASPVKKIVDSWNDMVDMICQFDQEIKQYPEEYPSYRFMKKGRVCPKSKGYGCGCGDYEPEFNYRNSLGI